MSVVVGMWARGLQPARGEWVSLTSAPGIINSATTLTDSGLVHLLCGRTSTDPVTGLLTSIWTYNWYLNTWSTSTQSTVSARFGMWSISDSSTGDHYLGGGKGGFRTTPIYPDTWKFNSRTNTWTVLAPWYTTTPGIQNRFGAYATANRIGNDIYVWSGQLYTGTPSLDNGSALWKYSIISNTWTRIPNVGLALTPISASGALGDRFEGVGGISATVGSSIIFTNSYQTRKYDTTTGLTTILATLLPTTGRFWASGGKDNNDGLVLAGGTRLQALTVPGTTYSYYEPLPTDTINDIHGNPIYVDYRETRRYDPVSNTWSVALANMPIAKAKASHTIANGRLYVLGGINAWGTSAITTSSSHSYRL